MTAARLLIAVAGLLAAWAVALTEISRHPDGGKGW